MESRQNLKGPLQFTMLVNGLLGRLIERVVNFHYSGLVATSVAIIGCGKHRDNHSIVLPLIPFHHQLMRSCNKVEPIYVSELLCNILAKSVAGPAWRDSPATTADREIHKTLNVRGL